MPKTFGVTLALNAVLGGIVLSLAWPPSAPKAAVTTIEGVRLTANDWRGRPALVTFWASDCATCLREIPALKSLQQRYASRGLQILAIAMTYDMPSRVVSLSRSLALPYPVALDPLGEQAAAFGQVRWTPTTFLLGRNGRILQRGVGAFEPDALAEQIEFLLEH